ncbi:MAG: rhomboid family intramembrane serine protease [Bryobacterales bacterium]|nr:rhomboid family intramembrane serine protease [Bryobacterales bacterium]
MDKRRMCPHCRAFITTSDRVCPYCDEKVGPRAVDRRNPGEILGGLIPHARFTTVVILTLNFGIYAATALYSMQAGNSGAFLDIDGRTLFDFGAKLREAVLLGQWWRLVTAGFLHGGLLHILMNSWVLYDLGSQVEEIYGSARFVVFYWCATVLGFLFSTFWSAGLSVGASAGLFGLIGAMIALGVKGEHPLGGAVRGHYIRWAVYLLLFGLLPGLRVDNAAHIGGLAAGFGAAYLAGMPRAARSLGEKIWQAAAYACILATGFCFIQMYLWFSANA